MRRTKNYALKLTWYLLKALQLKNAIEEVRTKACTF